MKSLRIDNRHIFSTQLASLIKGIRVPKNILAEYDKNNISHMTIIIFDLLELSVSQYHSFIEYINAPDRSNRFRYWDTYNPYKDMHDSDLIRVSGHTIISTEHTSPECTELINFIQSMDVSSIVNIMIVTRIEPIRSHIIYNMQLPNTTPVRLSKLKYSTLFGLHINDDVISDDDVMATITSIVDESNNIYLSTTYNDGTILMFTTDCSKAEYSYFIDLLLLGGIRIAPRLVINNRLYREFTEWILG